MMEIPKLMKNLCYIPDFRCQVFYV